MTKTRLTIILVFVLMMLSQLVSFADSGLVEVEVGINDSKVYFNNKALNNDELAFPFIRYNDVIYFPLAWNSLKAIGYQPITKEGSTDLNLVPLELTSNQTFEEKAGKPVSGTKKAEIKKVEISINNESLKNGEYPTLKFNNVLYMPLTWDVLNQLGLYYSADDLGDMHISSLSKKALDESITKANDAYVGKLVKFVKGVNRSLPDSEAERYVNAILKESATYGIDETWIFAMVWQESRFNATCEYKGAVGIMQILVSTGKNFGLSKQDLLVPEKSIRAGVQYVKSGFDRFGSIEKAIIAYNQGSYRVEKGNYSTWYLDEIKEKREALLKKLD